jgi:hypothetical protein
MEKKIKTFEINYDLEWKYGVEISKIREDLDAIEKLGATCVEIDTYQEFGDYYISIVAHVDRLETDEECLKRIEKEQRQIKFNEDREIGQLRKLKEKYPDI